VGARADTEDIPLARPVLGEEEELAVLEVLRSGQLSLGPRVPAFEQAFAARLGAAHASAVSSGTAGLHLAVRIAGVGPGDEVITSPISFVASANSVLFERGTPVFADVDEATFNIDPAAIEAAITPRTKAVIPVHLTGAMVDMPRLLATTQRHGIPVLEDACQGIKSSLDGRAAGSWGRAGTFSLHPLKFLNIWGDGGVITTDDEDLARRLTLLRNHGLETRDLVVTLGENSRLDTVQAVVALHVLEQADGILAARQKNAAFYHEALAALPAIKTPPRDPRLSHSYVTYQILAERRDDLLQHCLAHGVDCKIHYPVPLYCQPGLRHLGYAPGRFPVADRHARTALTLPVHQYLRPDQLSLVVDTIIEFYRA
jgi:aminotransferase EvaB